ncbi:MAG: DUF3617 domain-containing protein [Acidobacteriaceae bacterium]
MPIAKIAAVLFSMSIVCSLALHASKRPRYFQPGAWQIDSVTTSTAGRTVTSQTSLCAKQQMDFWKVAQAGLTCKTPKIHPESAEQIRVRIHCEYIGDRLHSDIFSVAIETISDHGTSFTLDGTTTTNTKYQGVQPKRTSVHLHATAHRTGNCE